MFTSEQLRILVKSTQSSERADIYASVLKDDFLRYDEDLYKIDHKCQLLELCPRARIQNILITVISDIFYKSEQSLNSDQLLILRSKEYSGYSKLSSPASIKSILPLIDERLFSNDVDLVGKKNQIHFKNGYIDVLTGKFKKRKNPTLYYVDRDYVKSEKEHQNYIMSVYEKIYPVQEEREYIFNTLASAFTGDAKRDRSSLFLIGKSSAGKSLLMQTIRSAFGNTYVKEFGSDTFSKSNTNKNKIFNEFIRSQQIRLCWVNELQGKIDDSLFKSFCEGSVHTISLYKDGLNEIMHNCKVVLTANELPNIRIDSGTENRIVSHEHRSYFTDNDNEIDETKYVFKKDKKLLDKINNNESYQNAIVDIFLKYTKDWFKNGLKQLPESMQANKNDIISSNDYVQDFIDKHIVHVQDARLGKNELKDAYISMYPNQKRSLQQIISMFKDKNFEYKADMRCNGIKGCFINIDLKEDYSTALKYSRSPIDIETIKKQQREIEQLKKMIEEMKQQQQTVIDSDTLAMSEKSDTEIEPVIKKSKKQKVKVISTKPKTEIPFESLMNNTLKLF